MVTFDSGATPLSAEDVEALEFITKKSQGGTTMSTQSTPDTTSDSSS